MSHLVQQNNAQLIFRRSTYTFPEKHHNSSFPVRYRIIFNSMSRYIYSGISLIKKLLVKINVAGCVAIWRLFKLSKWEHRLRLTQRKQLRRLQPGAGKVKVHGFGKMKVAMMVPSAGEDEPCGSCKAGMSCTCQDRVCSGAGMAKVRGYSSSLTLRIHQTHPSCD